MDICIKAGRRVRYLRTSKGIYQADLAEKAHISRETLSRIENGRIEPCLRVLHRIAKALGVRLADLLEGVD